MAFDGLYSGIFFIMINEILAAVDSPINWTIDKSYSKRGFWANMATWDSFHWISAILNYFQNKLVNSLENTSWNLITKLIFSGDWYQIGDALSAAPRDAVFCFASDKQPLPRLRLRQITNGRRAGKVERKPQTVFLYFLGAKQNLKISITNTLTVVPLTLHWKLGSGTPSASHVKILCLASSARCLLRRVITGLPEVKTWQR